MHNIEYLDVPIDADRKQQTGNLVTGQETINAPAGASFLLEQYKFMIQLLLLQELMYFYKKKMLLIYKNIFHQQNHQKEGQPKYYAMFGGATGDGDTNSGRMILPQSLIRRINLECILIKCQRF